MRTLSDWTNNTSWKSLLDWQRSFDRAFESALLDNRTEERVFHPHTDIEETENHYVVNIDIPGVAKKDLNIEVRDEQLVVSGERKSAKKEAGFSERVYGKFQRVIALPTGIDPEKIEAQYEDGVLAVAIPKAESVKPRQIKIGEGNKGSFFGRLVGGAKETNKPETKSSSSHAA